MIKIGPVTRAKKITSVDNIYVLYVLRPIRKRSKEKALFLVIHSRYVYLGAYNGGSVMCCIFIVIFDDNDDDGVVVVVIDDIDGDILHTLYHWLLFLSVSLSISRLTPYMLFLTSPHPPPKNMSSPLINHFI